MLGLEQQQRPGAGQQVKDSCTALSAPLRLFAEQRVCAQKSPWCAQRCVRANTTVDSQQTSWSPEPPACSLCELVQSERYVNLPSTGSTARTET